MIGRRHFRAVLERGRRKTFELKGAREWARIEQITAQAYLEFLTAVVTGYESEAAPELSDDLRMFMLADIAFQAGWDLRGELEAQRRQEREALR